MPVDLRVPGVELATAADSHEVEAGDDVRVVVAVVALLDPRGSNLGLFMFIV